MAEAVDGKRPFATLAALHEAMRGALVSANDAKKRALLNAHPDLAGTAVRAGAMTADSQGEQTSAGLDRLTEEEFKKFHQLNEAYRKKFGFPFIICVRRHGKELIFRQFEARLSSNAASEHATALDEVVRIAALRLDQHVVAPDKLKVHGRLSTHVLDTDAGRPAQGVAVELRELFADGGRVIAGGVTNADGRTDAPLIDGRPLPIARYELRFAVGGYFKGRGVARSAAAFSRRRAGAVRDRRARGPLSRAADRDALELHDLPRQLMAVGRASAPDRTACARSGRRAPL